jgi:hypothetical protein
MTQDEINLMVEQAGFHGVLSIGVVMDSKQLETLIKLAAAKEREACAKVVGEFAQNYSAYELATIIRARGQA